MLVARHSVAARLGFAALALAACGGTKSSDGGADASALPAPGSASASIGPIEIAGGVEETVCIYKRLDNPEAIMATSFVADLAPGSHHLIVYRSTSPEEDLEPRACAPFVGLLGQSDVPLMLVGKRHTEYVFPSGVGIALPAHQMLKIEAHYINSSAAPMQGQATVQVHGLPLTQAAGYQAADFGFWGTTHIDIPAKSAFSTGVTYQPGIAGTKVFGVSSHQHRMGTRVQVWQSRGAADADAGTPGTPVLDEQDWSNPAFKTFDPPLTFDGTDGFDFKCDWSNTTDKAIQFGESALNEMCFVGVFYYPSHGFDLCLNGRCQSRR